MIFDSNGIQSRPPLYRVSQILHIEQAHVDDNENVVCIAENTVGKVTSTVTVNVHCKRFVLMNVEPVSLIGAVLVLFSF